MDKPIDLFKDIDEVYQEYLLKQDKERKLYEKMNEEIEKSKRRIRDAYQDKIDKSKKERIILNQKIKNYKEALEKYSTFNADLIGGILERLVTVFEGEKFTYQKADYDTYEYESTVYGSELFNVQEKLLMIVKGNQKFGNYRDYNEEENTVRNLVNKRHAIVLDNDYNIYKKDITFYNEYIFINTDKFTYVKNFIDSVINYRFQNNLEQISEAELLTLLREFIVNHKQIIFDNYHSLTIERQNELKEYFEQEQLKLYRQKDNN